MTESEEIVKHAESLGWQCYGEHGDTAEQKVNRRWFDAEDPSELQEGPPSLPDYAEQATDRADYLRESWHEMNHTPDY